MGMIAIALGISLGACKPTDIDGAAAAGEADGGDRELTPTEALGRKNSAYVKCLNGFSERALRGRREWLETFPKGPSPKQAAADHKLYGPSALDDLKECREGIAAAGKLKPSLPELEAAGAAYLAALGELQPLTVRLHEYFEQGNYKDDKLALAIELHPKLIAAYDRFLPADRALGAEVDKLEDRINATALADIEKTEGKQLHWHHKRMLIEARRVVTLAAGARTLFEIDPAALQAAVAALDTAATELLAYFKQHEEEIEKRTLAYDTRVESPLKTLVKEAKELMRRNRDKRAFTSSEKDWIGRGHAEHVEGHPTRVIDAYNSLINRTNGLRF